MANVMAPRLSYSLSVTDASGGTQVALDPSSPQIRLANKGTGEVFVQWGSVDQTATTTAGTGYKVSILSGAVESFTKGSADRMSAVCATGETATLRVVVGSGD